MGTLNSLKANNQYIPYGTYAYMLKVWFLLYLQNLHNKLHISSLLHPNFNSIIYQTKMWKKIKVHIHSFQWLYLILGFLIQAFHVLQNATKPLKVLKTNLIFINVFKFFVDFNWSQKWIFLVITQQINAKEVYLEVLEFVKIFF